MTQEELLLTKTVFLYSKFVDLVYHVLAHMQVSNASNLYSETYIRMFEPYREENGFSFDLKSAVNEIQGYYNQNFERLGVVNFLPFAQIDEDLDTLKSRFLHHAGFTREDKINFIEPFVSALEKESLVYFPYWESVYRRTADERKLCEEQITTLLQPYELVFEHDRKNQVGAFLSFSMTCNGRGLYRQDGFFAAVPMPKGERDIIYAFFQLLHEYTHQFTDALLHTAIRMDDGTHDLSENLVILTDYVMIKKVQKEMTDAYLSWLSVICGNSSVSFDEGNLWDMFPIPSELKEMMMKEITNIFGASV